MSITLPRAKQLAAATRCQSNRLAELRARHTVHSGMCAIAKVLVDQVSLTNHVFRMGYHYSATATLHLEYVVLPTRM